MLNFYEFTKSFYLFFRLSPDKSQAVIFRRLDIANLPKNNNQNLIS
jgi:hypothetical protein